MRSDYIESKCSLLYHKVQIAINISNIYVLDEVNMNTHTICTDFCHEVKGQSTWYLKFFVSSTRAGAASGPPPQRFQQVGFVLKQNKTKIQKNKTQNKERKGAVSFFTSKIVSPRPRNLNHENAEIFLFLIYEVDFFHTLSLFYLGE